MRTRILMLNFPTEISNNWGCKASCKGLKYAIEKAFPGCILKTHKINFRMPVIEFSRRPEEFELTARKLIDLKWQEFRDLKWADIVILDGEGSIHEFEKEVFNNFVYLRLLAIFSAKKMFHKKVMIVNHTVDFKGKGFEDLIKAVYPLCDYISVREPISQSKLLSLGIKAELTADSVFNLADENTDMQGVKVRFRLPDKYYVFFLSQIIDLESEYLKNLCKEIWAKTKLPAVFFILSKKEKELVSHLKNLNISFIVIDYFVEPEDIIKSLRGADFCLSGRFHAAIFSAMAGIPFVAFRANTHKIAGLIEMLKYPIPEMIFGKTDIKDIIETISFIQNNYESIKSNLISNALKARELATDKNVKLLKLSEENRSLIRGLTDEFGFCLQYLKKKMRLSIYKW